MKTQNDYLLALEDELKYLKTKDRKDVIKYYREKINTSLDYGENIEKVLSKLPHPQIVAKEIYHQKGISFIKKQTKLMNRKKLFDGFASILALLLVSFGFVVALAYIIILLINKVRLLFNIFKGNLIEIFLNESFVLTYIIISVIIIIFFLDLFLIIFNYLIVKIKRTIYIEFSFRKLFDKIFKNNNFLGKVLGVTTLIFVGIGLLSYFYKTYFYRVLIDYPLNEVIYEITDEVDVINFNNYEANIKVVETDNDIIKIKHQFELNREFKLLLNDKRVTLQTTNSRTFDLLNLLKEPTQIITIYLPKTKTLQELDLDIEKGIISIENVIVDDLKLAVQFGKVAIEQTNVKAFKAVLNQVDVGFKNNQINNLNINIKRGLFKVKDDKINNLDIFSSSADIGIEGLTSNSIKLINGPSTVVMVDINCQTFDGVLNASNFHLKRFSGESLSLSGSSNQINLSDGTFTNLSISQSGGSVNGNTLKGFINVLNDSSTLIILFELDGSLKLENEGDTFIGKGLFELLELNIKSKVLRLNDITFGEGTITITKGMGILDEVYGKQLTLHLDNASFTFTNSDETKYFDEIIKDYKNETIDSITGVNVRKKE